MDLDQIQLSGSGGGPNRGTRLTTKKRVLKIAELIRNGYTRARIFEELEKEGLSNIQSKRLYKAAIDYITPDEEERDKMRDEILAITRNFIEKCIEDKDRKNALRALDQLNKMLGNYTEKIDANINSDISINFNIDVEDDGESN